MHRSKAAHRKARRAAKSDALDESNSHPTLRHAGIRVIGKMPWRTHICVFYDTKNDLLDTCVSYFEARIKGP